MIFRPILSREIDSVLALVRPDPSTAITADLVRSRLASREYRTSWIWVAEPAPGRTPMALAIWWGRPKDRHPSSLDALFALPESPSPFADSRTAVAAALLTAAHQVFAACGLAAPPPYHLFLPPDWRERLDVASAVAWRQQAAQVAGLGLTTERIRFEWDARRPVPRLSERLRFRPEPDDEVFVDLFRRCLSGSLDVGCTREAALLGTDTQARSDVEFYRREMLGRRTWWRIVRTSSGEVVGFGIPSRNSAVPVVGYLGVLPEFRGRGFAAEILAEITKILAAQTHSQVIRADTDLTNHPMIAAFELVGYRDHARRLVLSAHPRS